MPSTRKKRFARRLQVRFWKRGEKQAHTAYTTNISATGMFIGTSSPLKPGSRVRVEVLEETGGFMIEGEVAHAARVSPLLKKLRDSGMGVRFLSVEELVAEILPNADVEVEEPIRRRAGQVGGDSARQEAEPERSTENEEAEPAAEAPPAPEEPPLEPPEPAPPPPAKPQPARGAPAAKSAAKPSAKPPRRPLLRMRSDRTFRLRFGSLPGFLTVFERDIRNGGVFVATQKPAELHERITVEILVPSPIDRSARFSGKVVHVAEPMAGAENLLAGMGIEFDDPDRVVSALEALVYTD